MYQKYFLLNKEEVAALNMAQKVDLYAAVSGEVKQLTNWIESTQLELRSAEKKLAAELTELEKRFGLKKDEAKIMEGVAKSNAQKAEYWGKVLIEKQNLDIILEAIRASVPNEAAVEKVIDMKYPNLKRNTDRTVSYMEYLRDEVEPKLPFQK